MASPKRRAISTRSGPRRVPQGVVDVLEAVEVHEQQRGEPIVGSDGLDEGLLEAQAVGQAGERVVVCQEVVLCRTGLQALEQGRVAQRDAGVVAERLQHREVLGAPCPGADHPVPDGEDPPDVGPVRHDHGQRLGLGRPAPPEQARAFLLWADMHATGMVLQQLDDGVAVIEASARSLEEPVRLIDRVPGRAPVRRARLQHDARTTRAHEVACGPQHEVDQRPPAHIHRQGPGRFMEEGERIALPALTVRRPICPQHRDREHDAQEGRLRARPWSSITVTRPRTALATV